jgi:hypothetical protein
MKLKIAMNPSAKPDSHYMANQESLGIPGSLRFRQERDRTVHRHDPDRAQHQHRPDHELIGRLLAIEAGTKCGCDAH